MIVIPAVDIKGGPCVRLKQGRMSEETVYSEDPVQMAATWCAKGAERVHLVDLDGAVGGKRINAEVIRTIARSVPVPQGRIEFDTIEEGREDEIVSRALRQAVLDVFRHRVFGVDLGPLLERFDQGLDVETSDLTPASTLLDTFGDVPGLAKLLQRLGVEEESPGVAASALEFELEGLHLSRRLNKDEHGGVARYAAPGGS